VYNKEGEYVNIRVEPVGLVFNKILKERSN